MTPDGGKIASGSEDKTVKIWNVKTAKCLKTIPGEEKVSALVWSPDGEKIAIGSSDTCIRIYETFRDSLVMTLKEHSKVVTSLCWSYDGSFIVSGSSDGNIKFWNSSTGACEQTLELKSAVSCVSISKNDLSLVSAGIESIILWEFVGERKVRGNAAKPGENAKSLTGDDYIQNHLWKKSREVKDKWIFRMNLKKVEDSFSCKGSSFKNCQINESNFRDLGLKIIIE